MTMEIDALHAGQQMLRNGLDPCDTCADWLALKAENSALRFMLAVRVAGAALYADDGEMQDSSTLPTIDFKRDSAADIERKLIDRGIRRFVQDMNALGPNV